MVSGACERTMASGLHEVDTLRDSSKIFGQLSELQGPWTIRERRVCYPVCGV